ncbi:MAG: DUF6134 family protein [Acetobacteraceae bacterium]
MIGRRTLVGALALSPIGLATPLRAGVPREARLGFRVFRNDSPIGTHILTFARDGERTEVRIAIDLAVRFLGITAYRYTHRNTERWSGEQLLSIDSETDRNGRAYRVQARANGRGIEVDGTQGGRYLAPADAVSTSYWHGQFLRSVKIDTQGGRLLRTGIEELGEETIRIAGTAAPARRFRVSGDLVLDIWYDREGIWSGLLFTGEDGSTIRYERT